MQQLVQPAQTFVCLLVVLGRRDLPVRGAETAMKQEEQMATDLCDDSNASVHSRGERRKDGRELCVSRLKSACR
jgi:hypothetical protein